MHINTLVYIFLLLPCFVYLCNHELNNTSGSIIFLSYDNNIECTWLFNISLISQKTQFRTLQLTFRRFDTEFGHDELFIGETIPDVSKYNSKLYRFSGSKLPDPCLIPLRGDILTRSIWIQFISDQTNTGSGFIIDYSFLVNQPIGTVTKSQEILIDTQIIHPLEQRSKANQQLYAYPYGAITSPNYPQNYTNHIICRWHLYRRNSFIRLHIDDFHTELHYDTLTLQLGQNLNNRAMIIHELSGDTIENKHLFIRNENLFLIFNTDKSYNASGFSLRYEIIEKEIRTWHLYEDNGAIQSDGYPKFLRTNIEYTWFIHMNSSNDIEINVSDIDIDPNYDELQIVTGDSIHSVNTLKSFRFITKNETKLVLRTRHSNDDYQYRGFNLQYKKIGDSSIETNDQSMYLPCGKKFTSANGTIEFQLEITTSFECLILIEVDDGQNLFIRVDYLKWDSLENYMDIGLSHDLTEQRIYHISDALPGTWFIANHSQLWIRFFSSQFSLGLSAFRLCFSETIEWSTSVPQPFVEVLDDNRQFPFRLVSKPTNGIYQNLSQPYLWHIHALDDEALTITFQHFNVIQDRHLCFHVKDLFQSTQICSNQVFPFVHYHIGSCILSIEPEFIWILATYDIHIDKSKKIAITEKVNFTNDHLSLVPSKIQHSFVHIEWFISMNESSKIILDVENFNLNTPAELIVRQDENITKTYVPTKTSPARFCDILISSKSPFRIIYKSVSNLNQSKLVRLNLYKLSKNYSQFGSFHYILWNNYHSLHDWTIKGWQNDTDFIANLYSSNENLSLQTTADVNISVANFSIHVPSTDFDIRYKPTNTSANETFVLVLYEQKKRKFYESILLNESSAILETNDYASYNIQTQSTMFDAINFVIISADSGTLIRVYDLNVNDSGYFLLNSSSLTTKGILSPVGLRFSLASSKVKLELQSSTKYPIKLRYTTRTTSLPNNVVHPCFIVDTHASKYYKTRTVNQLCSNWFNYISMSINNTRINHLWPYAYRGSITLVIENTTIEHFEKAIYRNLRQSIAKLIRKFCLQQQQQHCSSEDADLIRADHVIILNYEEQLDNHHLYVSIFIKDPYRQTIALTSDQFLLALQHNQQELYQDINHHINLPSTAFDASSLDSIWLYGVCLLALLVLVVVILMLITIFVKRTSKPTAKMTEPLQAKKPKVKLVAKKDNSSVLIAHPVPLASEDENYVSSCCNETVSSDTSNPTTLGNLPELAIPYHNCSTARTSYFNSTIETALKGYNYDDEPIPFIDDNISTTHSRKSSACWSDRTSMSSRFSLALKLNRMRSAANARSILSNEKNKRRNHHRTVRYAQTPSQQN